MANYLLLTVDTEALPNRALNNHVDRLILGIHENGTAGIREMTDIVSEFNTSMVFFMDLCGAYAEKDKVLNIARWLNDHGMDVELHLHPEYLPTDFWNNTKFNLKPRLLNVYEEKDAEKELFLLKTFSDELAGAIGRRINAFRAGSFRWNSLTLEALKKLEIPLSFNNTQAAVAQDQCPYASSLQKPFLWSNGIIEVPVTEKNFFPRFSDNWWVRFQYPLCSLVRYRSKWCSFIPYSVSPRDSFLVCLMHSWSFLHRNEQGFEYYKNDKRMEDFRKMVKKMSRDFDIIDSRDLLDLIKTGKIVLDHTEDISKTIYVPKKVSNDRSGNFKKNNSKNHSGNSAKNASKIHSENSSKKPVTNNPDQNLHK